MSLVARLFLDLGGVEQRRDDRGRANSDGYPRFDQLGSALFARFVSIVVAVAIAHGQRSMAFNAGWEAA